jgi:hypothetical protein
MPTRIWIQIDLNADPKSQIKAIRIRSRILIQALPSHLNFKFYISSIFKLKYFLNKKTASKIYLQVVGVNVGTVLT